MFGGGNFGSNTPTFGGGAFPNTTTNTSVFGQPQQQPQVSTSLFGGGGFNQPKATFGSTFGSPQSSTMFGQQNRLTAPTTGGLFSGQTATVSPFSATGQTMGQTQVPAGTSFPFTPISGSDTMMKNGQASPISTRHQCITCMKEYENKSLEELRLEDYQLNRKGPQQGVMFGSTQPQQQQSTGLFSSFGSSATTTPFGQTSTFGAAATSTPSSGWMFNSLNQPKPQTGSFFSQPTAPVTSTTFGASPAFSFTNQTSQPASVFGANNTTVSTGGLGQTSTFTFGQPQAQTQSTGIFGQKPMTSAPSTAFGGGFGASAFTNTSTANKPTLGFSGFGTSTAPTFGTTTTNFGTGTSSGGMFGFQNQTQNKPFSFSTPFATQSQAQPTQPTFGAPSTGFSFNTAATTAPTMGFGTSASTFGGLGNTMNSFSTPTFGSTQPSLGFGFGQNTTTTPGFSSFTPATMFSPAVQQQQNTPQPGAYGFATTPYKDSPLFYNLIANRDFDNMVKPTSAAAQRAIKEASRRRTSTSLSFSFPAQVSKNVTYPSPQSFSKHAIFDGFEDEEDKGFSIDILSPKTMVKKLTLKSLKNSLTPNHRQSISFSTSPHLGENGFVNDSADASLLDLNTSRGGSDTQSAASENDSPTKYRDEDYVELSGERAGVPVQLIQKRRSGTESLLVGMGGGDNNAYEEHKCRVVNTRAGYYIEPPIETLEKCVDDQGNCFVKGLVIGRLGHGEIRYIDVVNVAGVNIDEIVHFRHKEVVVYPDDSNKPPVGSGLNCPAFVCLDRVWPIDKATKDPIKYPLQLQNMGYENSLRRSCSRLGAEFISYVPETGVWTFKVPHFSKYSCDVEEAETDTTDVQSSQPPIKGLGGVLMQINQYVPTSKTLSSHQQSSPRFESLLNEGKQLQQQQQTKLQQMDIEDDCLPLIRNQVARQSTPVIPMATDDFGYSISNVEHNPLTPTDSNDSESDWVPDDLFSGKGQYESVLQGTSETSAVRMMKSALMFTELAHDKDTEIQPPTKKFRSPLLRSKSMAGQTIAINISDADRRKSLLELKQRRPGPPIKTLVTLKEQDEVVSPFGTDHVTSITRRHEVSKRFPENILFSKLSLHTTNGNRYIATPRVTFGPLGTFMTVTNSSKMGSWVNVKKIKSYMDLSMDATTIQLLEKQLSKQMARAEPQPEDQIHVLQSFCLQNELHPTAKDAQREVMMWELFQMLWPRSEEEGLPPVLETRDNVSKWLSKYCEDLFSQTLGKNAQISVLGLLKMGRREEACMLAVKNRNPYLALLMSQAALVKASASNCKEQLDVWQDEGALDLLSKNTVNIYRLCAGDILLDSIDISKMTTSEWLQHFAIYLWYCCPPQVSIKEALASFQQLLKYELVQRTGWIEEEISRVAFPSVCDSSLPNLCVQLLKLYCFEGYPLRSILDPDTYSEDCLDYKLAWLLMVHLRPRNFQIYEDHFSSIATSFSYQLEQVGLYPWAVFVTSRTQDRALYHNTLVERNLGTWGTVEHERFLLENSLLRQPQFLFNSRVTRESKEDNREYGGIWYLLKSGNVQKSFDELEKFFNVEIMKSSDIVDSLLELIKLMKPFSNEIRNWNTRGWFMLGTLELLQIRKSYENRGRAKFLPNLTDAEFYKLISLFLKSFAQYKPMNAQERAVSIELAVLVQKIVAELIINNPELKEKIGVGNVSGLIHLSVPQDYKNELRYFVNALM